MLAFSHRAMCMNAYIHILKCSPALNISIKGFTAIVIAVEPNFPALLSKRLFAFHFLVTFAHKYFTSLHCRWRA